MNSQCSKSRVDWSAQWTSSITNNNGDWAAKATSAVVHRLQHRRALRRFRAHRSLGKQAVGRMQARDRRVGFEERAREVRALGGQPAQRLAERKVRRRAVTEVETVPYQDPPTGFERLTGDLLCEPGLAGAGIATEQHGAGGGPIRAETDQRRELCPFVDPADERRVNPDRHIAIMARPADGF